MLHLRDGIERLACFSVRVGGAVVADFGTEQSGKCAQARWYLVHTQPRREFIAQDHLARQGYEVFLPSAWKTVRHARKLSTVKAAYFPGYLFVRFDTGTVRWRPIDGTRGVLRLVKAGNEPLAAPEGLVEALIDATDQDGIVRFEAQLKAGDGVRITSGPFADHFARVERLKGEERVQVLLALMHGTVRLDVPVSALRPAKE